MRRLALLATLSLSTAALAQVGPVTVEPQATPVKLGGLTLVSLRDAANISANNGNVFGVDQGIEAVDKLLAAAGAPTGQLSLSVNTLLVRLPGRVIMIDTGYGDPRGLARASLAKAGITPDQVTDVLISHGHGDHVGGLLLADGTPAFPKATVRMAAAEWASLKETPANAKLVASIAPQVQPFEPGATLAPGIVSVDLNGHTPGHSGYRITSKGKSLLAIGDMAHSYIVSLAKPQWAMGFDRDRPLAASRRTAVLGALAESGEMVFAPHFPYPGTGHVVRAGDGFTWKPAG
jgi:glyoxylase-like metal-dependent hydrolase (beta-lactamase superfamily II)